MAVGTGWDRVVGRVGLFCAASWVHRVDFIGVGARGAGNCFSSVIRLDFTCLEFPVRTELGLRHWKQGR
jgi:hypothetical protein